MVQSGVRCRFGGAETHTQVFQQFVYNDQSVLEPKGTPWSKSLLFHLRVVFKKPFLHTYHHNLPYHHSIRIIRKRKKRSLPVLPYIFRCQHRIGIDLSAP